MGALVVSAEFLFRTANIVLTSRRASQKCQGTGTRSISRWRSLIPVSSLEIRLCCIAEIARSKCSAQIRIYWIQISRKAPAEKAHIDKIQIRFQTLSHY